MRAAFSFINTFTRFIQREREKSEREREREREKEYGLLVLVIDFRRR